jgi:superfamily II DNA or RNA helicase
MRDDDLAQVLRMLGRAGLGLPAERTMETTRVGTIALHTHQVDAVERLQPLLQQHGGALLADDVGLGKTYVALALAQAYEQTCVLAPAGLVPMWRDAEQQAFGTRRLIVHSLHRFSRPNAPSHAPTPARRLVIVDEAHHVRTPSTRRYASVAAYCRRAHVLLLSASPVVNRVSDLAHLVALFLGARAHALSAIELHRLTVRRTARELATTVTAPRLIRHAPLVVPDAPSVTRALARLPPPVPTRDGVAAGALVTIGLVRAWCSSAAACLALLRRRRQRADVLDDILAQGRWPSADELRVWTITDDAVQLGFTSLLVEAPSRMVPPAAHNVAIRRAREQLAQHREALAALDTLVRAVAEPVDRARAEALRRIGGTHRGVTVIAFAQFTDTVRALGRQMRWEAGVATLTARGGRVAGGPMTRLELLQRVAPRAHGVREPAMHERVRLLLTTDLLAEGVNLQDAGVVVHLDQPWTPTAIAQREGRITRLGSPHAEVHAYTLRPPGGGAELLAIAARLRRKARAAMVVLTPDAKPLPSLQLVRADDRASPLQHALQQWASIEPTASAPITDAVTVTLPSAPRAAWLAAHFDGVAWTLWGGWFTGRERRTRASRDPRVLRAIVEQAQTMLRVHDARVTHLLPTACTQAERTVRLVLRRQGVRARAHAVIDVLQSPTHLAARRLRDLTSHATLRDRLTLAPMVARAARALRTLRGAGEERELEALLAPPTAPAPGAPVEVITPWLQAVIALGAGDVPPAAANAPAPIAPTLLLLLP